MNSELERWICTVFRAQESPKKKLSLVIAVYCFGAGKTAFISNLLRCTVISIWDVQNLSSHILHSDVL
jgi:hypothetical protein